VPSSATRPLPLPEPETQPFWDATSAGKLLIQRCRACGRLQFYPRWFCARCAGDVDWIEAAGTGEVHSFTIVRQNGTPPFDALVPYVLAVIELDEGVRMMGNVAGVDVEDVSIGMPVEVTFVRETDDVVLPMWRPAQRGER
jgi:uncharacterized OB-fold protein